MFLGALLFFGGDDVPKFEPALRLKYKNIDRIIRKLRQIYQEKPSLFEIPAFAYKVY